MPWRSSRRVAEWVQADFAIFSAGCVTIPIYPTYPPDLVAYIVTTPGQTLIVEDHVQEARVLEVRGKMAARAGRAHGRRRWTAGQRRHARVEALRRLVARAPSGSGRTLADRVASLTPADVASIVYTSGTTGRQRRRAAHGKPHRRAPGVGADARGPEGDVHLCFCPSRTPTRRWNRSSGSRSGHDGVRRSLDKVADNLREVRPHFIFQRAGCTRRSTTGPRRGGGGPRP